LLPPLYCSTKSLQRRKQACALQGVVFKAASHAPCGRAQAHENEFSVPSSQFAVPVLGAYNGELETLFSKQPLMRLGGAPTRMKMVYRIPADLQ
jgi:hypothetical protein